MEPSDIACFDICDEDSGDELFLTQVVQKESQVLLNKTMTMDDNFDFNLEDPEEMSNDESPDTVTMPQFSKVLSDM